jgi:hypothetical protein
MDEKGAHGQLMTDNAHNVVNNDNNRLKGMKSVVGRCWCCLDGKRQCQVCYRYPQASCQQYRTRILSLEVSWGVS